MAGRIPQNFIDDLLTRIDIIDVIDSYVPLRKAGRNHQARCPFHEEKTPSFTVSQEKQFYHCFGCGANGTAISFLMEHGGMNFVEAVEDLAARAGLDVPREGSDTPRTAGGYTELYELMELVIRFFCRQLREHPQASRAVDYLKKRGISGELAAEFELGFAPPGWDNLLREHGGSDAAQQRLVKAGLILKKDAGGYYDRFRDRVIFPIRDQRGRAVGFGGRVLDEGSPKYLNSPETAIFHKGRELYGLYQARHKSRNLEKLYIVEGYMDVLALNQYEIPNVVATLGTAVTQEHLDRLFKVCPQLIFCFDGDSAGKKAAWRTLEITLPLLRDGRNCCFMFLPEGEDPDSYIRIQKREKFEDPSTYVPLSDFLIEGLKQDIDLKSREGRALLTEKSIPYLAKLPANALRELLLKDIARESELSIDGLKKLLADNKPASRTRKTTTITRSTPRKETSTVLMGTLIKYLLQYPILAKTCQARTELSGVEISGIEFLMKMLDLIDSNPAINCAGILEHWRNSKYSHRLNELATAEIPLAEPTEIEAEFREALTKIKHTYQKQLRLTRSQSIASIDDLRSLYSDTVPTAEK